MKHFAIALLLFVAGSLNAQYRVVTVPLKHYNTELRAGWQGGMNSPQFSNIDLNHDSLPDLFVFDRVGDKVMTYLRKSTADSDTAFEYAPQYEGLFPPELNSWALIRDYNKDGIPDIFAHANAGIMVYKGRLINNELHFDSVCPLLLYSSPPYEVNIWTNIDDIPVITDVNFDGDLDILTYGTWGATIEYYENQTMEHPGDIHYTADSLKYAFESFCWGNFAQNAASNSIQLNVSCKGGGQANAGADDERHAGNAIYSFDADNDHDIDLLNGNIGYDNLAFIQNCGDSSWANACAWDSLFPSCNTSIRMPTYPAGYGINVSNDGLEDLLIAPNARAGSRDVNNVMYYRNTNNQACGFEYVVDSFLVQHTLDLGTDSKPYFFDFNGDGLMDIVAGNYGYFRPFNTYKSTLTVLLNNGTSSSPSYVVSDEDYHNFSNFGLVAMHPAFGDLDGDGTQDMVVGELNGYLNYFKNTGTSQANFQSMTMPNMFGLDIGQYSAPFIYDVNGDSLNDLVVGRKDGKLSYYWNFGTKSMPNFSQDSANTLFGQVNVTLPGYTEGYSTPFLTRDSIGQLLLYSGSMRGTIFKYLVDTNNLRSGSFTLLDTDVLKQDVGSKSTFSLADLNGDGNLEYVVGNSRGGLLLYSDSLWDHSTLPVEVKEVATEAAQLLLYPNPANGYFICKLNSGSFTNAVAELYNVLGEVIPVTKTSTANSVTVTTTGLQPGLYFIRITDAGRSYTARVLVR